MPSTSTKVDIMNYALTKIGDRLIASPTENTPRAKTMNLLFANVRDDLLRQNPWNFALKRVTLSKDTAAPLYEWASAYHMPSDFIKMQSTENNVAYAIEGRHLLTDAVGSFKIKYVYRVEDETLFDPMFTTALQKQLAYEASIRLTDDTTLQQILRSELDQVKIEAKAQDGKEDDSRTRPTYGWEDSRL